MPNRLALEASPYLRQHAENPVDWYPWGPEALERATREDRPILLSIGYSACHWCHVMAHESFESPTIADLMNSWFVNIKVDREERPDLDHVYQLVVQLMGASGGWPLTVFLTPDQKPFFGGTYFPPVDRYGMSGFPKVLQAVWEAYRMRRDKVDTQASEIARAIAQVASADRDGAAAASSPRSVEQALSPQGVERAMAKVLARFDDEHGGFGRRPKFPNSMALDLLLRAGDLGRVRQALDAMRAGGIWDQLGGGFHRYSTDERWLVPHFEKMLYDNAQLLRLYADAWRATGEPRYERTAHEIADYVAREMTSPQGGFFATQDADSEGEEGKFFVWTPAEVEAACAGDERAIGVARIVFDITDGGNFERSGATVLSLGTPVAAAAGALGLSPEEGEQAFARARSAMFAAREQRVHPFRDEKILASSNGLLIGALATAGAALGQATMLQAATRALSFVERALVVHESTGAARVLRHSKDGVVKGPGFLDDQAFVANAAVDLYEATGEAHWVRLARAIAESMLRHHYDEAGAGFFFTADDGEKILVRPKDAFDHATPSGVAMACQLLLRLGALVDARYIDIATRVVEKLAPAAFDSPLGMSVTVALVDRIVRGSVDVVLVGPRQSAATQALAQAVHRTYVRDRVLAWADPSDPAALEACSALAQDKPAASSPVAYVCRGRSCSAPLGDPEQLAQWLRDA
ncbi:MAG TPA: thioredoxin domain-containing protein [Polyangiaceae bacterium]|nr:thioredoxin domain-containing protein [Polyangiaceae bacterium]